MSNQIASDLKRLAKRAFTAEGRSGIVMGASEGEQYAFHRMHNHWLDRPDLRPGQERMMRERYPFVKLNGEWFVSVPKLYLYLHCVRDILASYTNDDMQAVHESVQSTRRYYEESKNLDGMISPKLSSVENYDQYQKKLWLAYETYCAEQLRIFS